MLHHHCRRNPELQEELQIQAAVAAGDVHTVRKMLEQGYSPNGRDANGWTLLHFSAARGKERCVRVFLEHGGPIHSLSRASFVSCPPSLLLLLLLPHFTLLLGKLTSELNEGKMEEKQERDWKKSERWMWIRTLKILAALTKITVYGFNPT